jgi:hypothetical protein
MCDVNSGIYYYVLLVIVRLEYILVFPTIYAFRIIYKIFIHPLLDVTPPDHTVFKIIVFTTLIKSKCVK